MHNTLPVVLMISERERGRGNGFDARGRPYKVLFTQFLLKINAFKIEMLSKCAATRS